MSMEEMDQIEDVQAQEAILWMLTWILTCMFSLMGWNVCNKESTAWNKMIVFYIYSIIWVFAIDSFLL